MRVSYEITSYRSLRSINGILFCDSCYRLRVCRKQRTNSRTFPVLHFSWSRWNFKFRTNIQRILRLWLPFQKQLNSGYFFQCYRQKQNFTRMKNRSDLFICRNKKKRKKELIIDKFIRSRNHSSLENENLVTSCTNKNSINQNAKVRKANRFTLRLTSRSIINYSP